MTIVRASFMAIYKCKYIFLLLWLVLGSVELKAQDTLSTQPKKWSKFSIGTRHGGAVSTIFEPNRILNNSEARLRWMRGYTGGISMQYYAQPNFSLQFEVNYTEKGWKEVFVDTEISELRGDSLFYQQNLSYVDIPIMAHGYIGQRNVRIYLEAGFFLSYLLSHSSEREVSITDEQISYRYEEGRDNKFNIGIVGGGGFEVATAVGLFQLGGRYSLGFSSVLDKNITQIPNPLLLNTVTITLGYYVQF